MFEPILLHAHNPGPMTGTGNNTFLLATGGTATLVDAGQGSEAHLRLIDEHLTRVGARLDRVLVTHAHPDHASGAQAISAAHPHVTTLPNPLRFDDTRPSDILGSNIQSA